MAGSELGAGTKVDDHRWLVRRREGAPPRLQLELMDRDVPGEYGGTDAAHQA